MRNHKLVFVLGITLVALAACSTAATQTPAPTATTEAATPTAVPTATIAPVVDECLACHTDKERLTSLATHEEHGEGESKGVG